MSLRERLVTIQSMTPSERKDFFKNHPSALRSKLAQRKAQRQKIEQREKIKRITAALSSFCMIGFIITLALLLILHYLYLK